MFELVPGVINVFAVYIVVNVHCNFSEVGFDFLPVSFGEDISLLQALLDITSEYGLTQIHDKPTREGNMLGLVFTNNPSLIKTTGNAPEISDHDIIITNPMIKPHYCPL
jgi:hypothetical protein